MVGSDWLESPGPPGGLLQISAGTNCLWAITRDKKCWVLKGNWPDIVQQREPMFEWIELPGQMKNIAVGMKDDVRLQHVSYYHTYFMIVDKIMFLFRLFWHYLMKNLAACSSELVFRKIKNMVKVGNLY